MAFGVPTVDVSFVYLTVRIEKAATYEQGVMRRQTEGYFGISVVDGMCVGEDPGPGCIYFGRPDD
ncbi:putative glyceraldehyde-3-phosphate dehydrogenase (phosphorylating) [Helianthus debilis subsp. tardiflorus]